MLIISFNVIFAILDLAPTLHWRKIITFHLKYGFMKIINFKDPVRIIVLILSSFFWLLSLLCSAILWNVVVPLKVGFIHPGALFLSELTVSPYDVLWRTIA